MKITILKNKQMKSHDKNIICLNINPMYKMPLLNVLFCTVKSEWEVMLQFMPLL